ncbi:hypothetical protein M758_UG056400 [Ceratodon purpureus]|nr:hypothetical protein M758_UG056400 [Ceratodon purpureus]
MMYIPGGDGKGLLLLQLPLLLDSPASAGGITAAVDVGDGHSASYIFQPSLFLVTRVSSFSTFRS